MAPKHARLQGVGTKAYADLNLIICNTCRHTALYAMTEEELVPIHRKVAKVWLFAVIIPVALGILVPAFLIWG